MNRKLFVVACLVNGTLVEHLAGYWPAGWSEPEAREWAAVCCEGEFVSFRPEEY